MPRTVWRSPALREKKEKKIEKKYKSRTASEMLNTERTATFPR
jgi:hypothetical protein